jgi:ribose transport system substrate-binding protein
MKFTRLICLLVVPFIVFALAGCNRGSGKPQVAFVTNNTEEFWTYAKAGCNKAEQEFGDIQVVFRRPPAPTATAQKEIIDALLNKGAKAVAVSVIDPNNQSEYLKTVADQVPLLTQDNDAPDSGRKCYIGTDNYEAGKAVGRMVKEAMPDGGTIAIFVGMMEPLNAQQRRQGVLDELAGTKDASGSTFGKYKLFSSGSNHGAFTDNVDRKVCKDKADFVLQKNSGNDLCLIGLWAYNPPAIYEAVKAANREGKVKIVAFDEMEETLDGIRDGHIHGTVVQQPFEFGYQSVKIMRELAKGNTSVLFCRS